jgi:hypothetical protein
MARKGIDPQWAEACRRRQKAARQRMNRERNEAYWRGIDKKAS